MWARPTRPSGRLVLDDTFTTEPRIQALTDSELGVRLRLLCHCAGRRDPAVGAEALEGVRALTARRVTCFVQRGLLDVVDGGYVVTDWPRYFPKDRTAAERKRRWRERRAS